jgi:hypothetical protein
MATENPNAAGRGKRRFLVPVVLLLLVAGAWVSWVGTRGQQAPDRDGEARAEQSPQSAGPVVSIELPHANLELPPGPHRDRFQVSCTLCHSPRLPLTQPPFPEKQWAEVVHKMVATYGAPLDPEEEREVVAYLTAVRGE